MTTTFLTLDADRLRRYAKARETIATDGVEATTTELADIFAQNPLVESGEPLLIVAQDEQGAVQGFCVSQPIPFRSDGQIHTVRWLGSAFMREDLRGQPIFRQLLATFFQTPYDFATGGNSAAARGVAKKTGFVQVSLPGPPVLGFARLAPPLLLPSKIGPALARPLLAGWTFLVSLPWRGQLRVERADERLEELLPLLADIERDGFIRTEEQIRWMVRHPWFAPDRRETSTAVRHHFYLKGKTLRYETYAIKRAGLVVGAFILSVTDFRGVRSCRCLDAGASDPFVDRHLATIAFTRAVAAGARTFSANVSRLKQSFWGRVLLALSRKRDELYSYFPRDSAVRQGFLAVSEARTTDGDLGQW